MRRNRFCITMIITLLCMACERRVANYPLPAVAQTSGAFTHVVVRPGDGPSAQVGGIWGVKWTLLSHAQRDCTHPCSVEGLYPKADPHFKVWQEILKSMHEGEVRRVWVTWPGERDIKTYDVELLSVVKTDAAGHPVDTNPYPNLGKPLPHEQTRKGSSERDPGQVDSRK
jgi:hypothetical protein